MTFDEWFGMFKKVIFVILKCGEPSRSPCWDNWRLGCCAKLKVLWNEEAFRSGTKSFRFVPHRRRRPKATTPESARECFWLKMENQGDQTHTKPDQRHTKSDQIKKCGGRSPLVALGCAPQQIGGRFGGFSIKLVCFFWLPNPATSSSLVDGLLLMADGHRGCAICT